jgi:hypothetical protein
VCVSLIHHMTKDGKKVAGSPAVVDSVRLAFTIRLEADTGIRAIVKYKGNVSDPDDIRFMLAGGTEPYLHTVFLTGETPATSAGDSLRERIRATTGEPAGEPGSAGLFRVLRRITRPDGTARDDTSPLVADKVPGREPARTLAAKDAGVAPGTLKWAEVPGKPGHEVSTTRNPVTRECLAYAVYPHT